MKKNKKMIAIIALAIILVVVGGILFLTRDANTSSVKKMFNAQMEAIKGDNSDAEKLGATKDYTLETQTILEGTGLTINESQHGAAKRALKEFDYEITDVKENEDGTYEVTFKIDSYQIAGSMTSFRENAADHLNAEELAAYETSDASNPAYVDASKKLLEAYYESLSSLKPITIESKTTFEIIDGDARMVDGSDFKKIIEIIVGVN